MNYLIAKFSLISISLLSIISCGFIPSLATSDGIYNDPLRSSYQIAEDYLNTSRNDKDYASYFKQKSNEYSQQLNKGLKFSRDSIKRLNKKRRNQYYNNIVPNNQYIYNNPYYNNGYPWAYQGILPFYYNHWDFPMYGGFYPSLNWGWGYGNPWLGFGFFGGYNYYNNFGYYPYGYGFYNPVIYNTPTRTRIDRQNTRRTNNRYSSGEYNYRTNYNVGRRANFNSTTTNNSQNTNNYNRGRQSQSQQPTYYNYKTPNTTSRRPSYNAPRQYSGSARRGGR